MAMREAVSFPKRAGKEFTKNAISLLVAYAPIVAILTLAAGTPLGGVLIFGAIAVPAMSALLTVLTVGVGGGDPHYGSRPYDYDPAPSLSSVRAAVTALLAVGTTTAGPTAAVGMAAEAEPMAVGVCKLTNRDGPSLFTNSVE